MDFSSFLTDGVGLYFLFVLIAPGAMSVWAFRFFTDSKKTGDFEYLMLSVFFGVLLAGFAGQFMPDQKLRELLGNPFASTLGFATMGILFAWVASVISREFWFKWIVRKLKTAKFLND